ncbi:MAG: GNAT family N-acetyltransferase [Propionibacteriaceae bacterium]
METFVEDPCREELLNFIWTKQKLRNSACAHLDLDAQATGDELEDLDPVWTDSLSFLTHNGQIRCEVCFEWEDDRSCAWMYGPWIEGDFDDEIAQLLDRACRDLQCEKVKGFFPAINNIVIEGLEKYGWVKSTQPAVSCTRVSGKVVREPMGAYRRAHRSDVDLIANLHGKIFPGAYLSVDEMFAQDRILLVDGRGLGYIAAVIQADGVGYIDYLGVAESARRQGIGRSLLRAALAELQSCPLTRLTTEIDNEGALTLFTAEGFTDLVEMISLTWSALA